MPLNSFFKMLIQTLCSKPYSGFSFPSQRLEVFGFIYSDYGLSSRRLCSSHTRLLGSLNTQAPSDDGNVVLKLPSSGLLFHQKDKNANGSLLLKSCLLKDASPAPSNLQLPQHARCPSLCLFCFLLQHSTSSSIPCHVLLCLWLCPTHPTHRPESKLYEIKNIF